MTEFKLKGLTNSFERWIQEGICPDCGGDLDENDECPAWYSEEPNLSLKLEELANKIPKFIKLRGCINCKASKNHKERTGHDYGFNHEDVIPCLIDGCVDYNHDLSHPFVDPLEVIDFARKNGNEEQIKNAEKYLSHMEEIYGQFYERMGINLNGLL